MNGAELDFSGHPDNDPEPHRSVRDIMRGIGHGWYELMRHPTDAVRYVGAVAVVMLQVRGEERVSCDDFEAADRRVAGERAYELPR